MFHELLAGAAPYAARQPTALLRQHLKAPLPQLPERLDAFQPLLERMLAKDPARRLANGAALAAEMEQVWQAMCS
jgi:serine/threonine-protein kinase PpkA